jgi:hypothetical protein
VANAINLESWHDLFVMFGGALAALTGLLFVATSIQIEHISEAPHWRLRAFGNMMALIALLTEATLMLTPQQYRLLGAEIIVLNAICLVAIPLRLFVALYRLKTKMPTSRLLFGAGAWLLGALGGVSLFVGSGPGVYLIIASGLILIWVCMINAWSLMTASR